jgi:hypothetical protein
MAFLRANVRLGVLGRERFHYWGCCAGRFFRRPSHLSLAVTLSIYGHHFRKICRVIVIAYDDTAERQQLDARITQAQRDECCVRRAVAVMALLIGLAVVGLGYAAVLLPQITLNLSRFFSQPSSLGLTALGCAFAFLLLGAVYRWRLGELHGECRRFAARVIASRLGRPAAGTSRAGRIDAEAGESSTPAGPEAARLDAERSSGPWRVTYE